MSPAISARPSSLTSGSATSRLGLVGAVVAGLTGCYAHHTADEELVESNVYSADAGANKDAGSSDGGVADAGAADPCGAIAETDVLGQILCDFTSGGATGNLGTPSSSQCKDVNPDDFATAALCAVGSLTGSGNNAQAGGLDIGTLLTLANLLGGGTQGTGSNANPLGGLLGALGGTQGSTGTPGNQQDLGNLLGLLGTLGGQAGTGTSATGSNANQPNIGALLNLLGGLNTQAGTGTQGTGTR